MTQFEIVEGPMRAGKTTYAKLRGIQGCTYFSHDEMIGTDFQQFYAKIVSELNDKKEDAIVDGWFSIYNPDISGSIITLTKNVPHKVIITVIFTPFDVIYRRKYSCGTPFEKKDIKENYKMIINLYKTLKDVEFVFIDSKDYTRLTFEQFMKRIRFEMLALSEKDIDEFSHFLSLQSHDRYYQTINLPFEKSLKGYERTELTWELVKRTINFRGCSVLDVGSYHGFTSFGAEDCGAIAVTGVDKTVQAVNVAERLKKMWNYETVFICEDIEKWLTSISGKKFDIVLCFNMIQYIPNAEYVIKKLFEIGKTVIFEVHEQFKGQLDAASTKTHHLTIVQESPRWKDLRRMLYYYEVLT